MASYQHQRLSYKRGRRNFIIRSLPLHLLTDSLYVDACIKAGMKIDEFAGRLSFFLIPTMTFEEIAKFRAARSDLGNGDKREIQAKGLSLNADAFSYTDSRMLLHCTAAI